MAFAWDSDKRVIGLAGELRVMSELFLRGHNPAKSYLDNGIDLILEDGTKIQVKSSHRSNYHKRGYMRYCFSFRGFGKNDDLNKFDYAILWCIDEDVFYILKPDEIIYQSLTISDVGKKANNRLTPYRENWDTLREK